MKLTRSTVFGFSLSVGLNGLSEDPGDVIPDESSLYENFMKLGY